MKQESLVACKTCRNRVYLHPEQDVDIWIEQNKRCYVEQLGIASYEVYCETWDGIYKVTHPTHSWVQRKRPTLKEPHTIFRKGDILVETGVKKRLCRLCREKIPNTEYHVRILRIAQTPASICEDCIKEVHTVVSEANNSRKE